VAVSDMFYEAVRERFAEFKKIVDAVHSTFGNTTPNENRKKIAQSLLTSARNLLDILPSSRRPGWLTGISQAASTYVNSTNAISGQELLRTIAVNFHRLDVESLIPSANVELDFDALYAELRASSELPQLFDKLIELTSELIATGEIDNVYILDGLERLRDVLKANKNGSYAADQECSRVASFLKDLAAEALKTNPTLEPIVNAWEKNVERFGTTNRGLAAEMGREVVQKLFGSKPISKLLLLPGANTMSVVVSSTITPLVEDSSRAVHSDSHDEIDDTVVEDSK